MKKILSILTATVMAFSIAGPSFAADPATTLAAPAPKAPTAKELAVCRKKASDQYSVARRSARDTFESTRKEAWKKYRTARDAAMAGEKIAVLQARKTKDKVALQKARDFRKTAVNNSWNVWKKQLQSATSNRASADKAALDAYNVDKQSCTIAK